MQAGDLIQSRYRLNRLLGSGASGSVWAAKNELIDRDVALKIMRPDVAEDAVALQRFFNEAKASGRVRSSSIVEILDLGQAEDGSPFLVFELLDGEGLDARLQREGTLEAEFAAEVFVSVAKALDLAHSQGIIHRDLKPANIFLHRDPEGNTIAKILDFGISKIFETNNNFTLTRTGTVVGSPAYMAPEQASGREDLDGRADVWSMGVVMYETLSGTLPHEAPNYNALMVRILTQDVDPLITRKPALPAALCTVVDTCLRRDRDQRVPGAGQVGQQLERALNEIRAVRYRSLGRRASDRAQGQFRRRASDFQGSDPGNGVMRDDPAPPPKKLLLAAGLGAVLGMSLTAIVFLLFVKG
ncbi:MAG: serine/threonine protein kinase [Polyangiaceae bacterium]|nr:serine/threonine protein kinase [Polyangiaceae bacterium]